MFSYYEGKKIPLDQVSMSSRSSTRYSFCALVINMGKNSCALQGEGLLGIMYTEVKWNNNHF